MAWSHAEVTAGALEVGSCPFACKTTSIGNSKKFKAHLAVTDKYGNVVTGLGASRKAKVEKASGEGTLVGATGITIPASGLAESATVFEYTSPASGTSEAVLKLKPEGEGTTYTEAEAHVKY
jgi:ribosomal protein S5